MKKQNYHPYILPLIKSYVTPKFIEESKVILKFLRKSALASVHVFEDAFWIYIQKEKPRKKVKPPYWMPKMYVCVQPQDYWSTLYSLIGLSQEENFSWKFCKDFSIFGRADKIVIYAESEKNLLRIFSKIRPLLKGKSFHQLRHARPSIQEGIYFGADPTFIKKASWRYYRWLINETLLKPNTKNGKLDRNTMQALHILNISLKHQGPKSFSPSSKHIKFIKEFWNEIHLP